MPANAVKPDEEYIWRQAKAKAKALGHENDWAYIMTIFQRMKKSFGKSFVIPQGFKRMRVPGQVPSHDRVPRNIRRLTEMPSPLTQARLENFDELVMRPEGVVRGLGFDVHKADEWARFAGHVGRNAENEMTVRQMLLERCREENIDSVRTRAIFQRGLSYWRHVQKSFEYVNALRVEELKKAQARGGKYHRRIPKPGGGYQYVYDAKQYQKRGDAHVNGEDASVAYVSGQIIKTVEDAGEGGCTASAFKPIVKKFGAEKVAKILEDGARGKIKYQGQKFTIAKEAKE